MFIERWKVLQEAQNLSSGNFFASLTTINGGFRDEHLSDLFKLGFCTFSQRTAMLSILSLILATDKLSKFQFIAMLNQVTDFFETFDSLIRAGCTNSVNNFHNMLVDAGLACHFN